MLVGALFYFTLLFDIPLISLHNLNVAIFCFINFLYVAIAYVYMQLLLNICWGHVLYVISAYFIRYVLYLVIAPLMWCVYVTIAYLIRHVCMQLLLNYFMFCMVFIAYFVCSV